MQDAALLQGRANPEDGASAGAQARPPEAPRPLYALLEPQRAAAGRNKAAHLRALHLPVDHEEKHAGRRGSHSSGVAGTQPGRTRSGRAPGVALEMDGKRKGHVSWTPALRGLYA